MKRGKCIRHRGKSILNLHVNANALPVSRMVVVQHSASYVHGVCPLADNDAVMGQQLGHVVKHCVVVHGQF